MEAAPVDNIMEELDSDIQETSDKKCSMPLSKKRKNGESVCGRKIKDDSERCSIHSRIMKPKTPRKKKVEVRVQDYKEALTEKRKEMESESNKENEDPNPAPKKKRKRSPPKKKPTKKKKDPEPEEEEEEVEEEEEEGEGDLEEDFPFKSSELAAIALDALPSGVKTSNTKKFIKSRLGEKLGNKAFGQNASSVLSKHSLLSYATLTTLALMGENKEGVSKLFARGISANTAINPPQIPPVPVRSSKQAPKTTKKNKKREIPNELFDGASV